MSSAEPEQEVIAAVDLGSNSFHMVVATLRHGQLSIIDRIRETVRLAEGLGPRAELAPAARERALRALEIFGERLREIKAVNVRAAGTNTLRRVRDDKQFVKQAESALGHPIEIISGIEEARLVYLGVAHSLPPHAGNRLVMDIGGGSTEVILGSGFDARTMESIGMGAVSVTEKFFPDGELTAERFADARIWVRLKLRPIKSFFRTQSAVEAIGTSGTILAVARIVSELKGQTEIRLTPEDVELLLERLVGAGSWRQLELPGLSARRAEVLAGGLAILAELMATLRIEVLRTSDGALREGLLYDLVGRIQHEDARVATVAAMARRYHVDLAQAERIAVTAESLRLQLADDWDVGSDRSRLLLCWASYLHEIGLDIAHKNFHDHGAYIVEHADMPGFPAEEQAVLASLIGAQRKSLSTRSMSRFDAGLRQHSVRLAALLRLAIILHRSRSETPLPQIKTQASADGLRLIDTNDWLQNSPLTVADLESQADVFRDAGIVLTFN